MSNKNIRPFADTNLLELKLELLKKLDGVADIVVSTDCKKSANIASKKNVRFSGEINITLVQKLQMINIGFILRKQHQVILFSLPSM